MAACPVTNGNDSTNLRAYYGFMWGFPGKKLLFMGQEFGQSAEWNFNASLDWHLLQYRVHNGVQALVRDLNRLHRSAPALHARDCEPEGFRWIVADDRDNSVYAWMRFAPDAAPVAVVCNFTPVPRPFYRIGLPRPGRWREVLNSDASEYGGGGMGNLGVSRGPLHPRRTAFPPRPEILVLPLAAVYFEWHTGRPAAKGQWPL